MQGGVAGPCPQPHSNACKRTYPAVDMVSSFRLLRTVEGPVSAHLAAAVAHYGQLLSPSTAWLQEWPEDTRHGVTETSIATGVRGAGRDRLSSLNNSSRRLSLSWLCSSSSETQHMPSAIARRGGAGQACLSHPIPTARHLQCTKN